MSYNNIEIAHVAAVSTNFCIGKDNKLPWTLPGDLKHFKEVTTANVANVSGIKGIVVMGRKTFESMGSRALPNRMNLVLTLQENYANENNIPLQTNLLFLSDLLKALKFAASQANVHGLKTIWIIGGENLFRNTMKFTDRLELTHVDTVIDEGDADYPMIPADFTVSGISPTMKDPVSGLEYVFNTYTRNPDFYKDSTELVYDEDPDNVDYPFSPVISYDDDKKCKWQSVTAAAEFNLPCPIFEMKVEAYGSDEAEAKKNLLEEAYTVFNTFRKQYLAFNKENPKHPPTPLEVTPEPVNHKVVCMKHRSTSVPKHSRDLSVCGIPVYNPTRTTFRMSVYDKLETKEAMLLFNMSVGYIFDTLWSNTPHVPFKALVNNCDVIFSVLSEPDGVMIECSGFQLELDLLSEALSMYSVYRDDNIVNNPELVDVTVNILEALHKLMSTYGVTYDTVTGEWNG